MITVSERAAARLQEVLAARDVPPGQGVKLVPWGPGSVGLTIAAPETGDEVVRYEDAPVLVVDGRRTEAGRDHSGSLVRQALSSVANQRRRFAVLIHLQMRLAPLLLLSPLALPAHDPPFGGPSDANPPVSEADIRIVRRARELLNSPAKWNRADDRECPPTQSTYSLYCALEKATEEVSKQFAHRGAAMQQARFVIDEVLAKGNHYGHRLKDYNNDPKTTFADVQKFFTLLEERIRERLTTQPHR